MTSPRILFSNGVVSSSPDTPSASTFLQTHPGAYTTTRSHNNGSCLMFWERHFQRLANSVKILFNTNPQLLFKSTRDTVPSLLTPITSSSSVSSMWDSVVKSLVNDSMNKVVPLALKERRDGEELAVTVLVSGDFEKLSGIGNPSSEICGVFDVHVHLSGYVPSVFGVRGNGVGLAVVGRGRDVAEAKYSDWVRLRKPLEKLRPPSVTELLLSNDGDKILEGSISNFFVVCRKEKNESEDKCFQPYNNHTFEVQTAPIADGVLPGVIRELVIEVCLSKGIPLCEVAPSWSEHDLWEEAFITNSLRILQHVESIQVPKTWEFRDSESWKDIEWKEKQFEASPGTITKLIQKEIMERATVEGYILKR